TGDDHHVTLAASQLLHRSNGRCAERIGQVWYDHANRGGLPALEAACQLIRTVAQARHDYADAFCSGCRDSRLRIQNTRRRLERNVGFTGYIDESGSAVLLNHL